MFPVSQRYFLQVIEWVLSSRSNRNNGSGARWHWLWPPSFTFLQLCCGWLSAQAEYACVRRRLFRCLLAYLWGKENQIPTTPLWRSSCRDALPLRTFSFGDDLISQLQWCCTLSAEFRGLQLILVSPSCAAWHLLSSWLCSLRYSCSQYKQELRRSL